MLKLTTLMFLAVAIAQQADEYVYEIGGGVTAPKVLEKVEPDYTGEATEARIRETCYWLS
jgi:hypothetical protein